MSQLVHASASQHEFIEWLKGYIRACREHDQRLLTAFLLCLVPVLQVVVAGLMFRHANPFTEVESLGMFTLAWGGLSLLAIVGLAGYILFTSERFHRACRPRCQRCTSSIRDLDDLVMQLSVAYRPQSSQAQGLRCDICDHLIACWEAGPFCAEPSWR